MKNVLSLMLLGLVGCTELRTVTTLPNSTETMDVVKVCLADSIDAYGSDMRRNMRLISSRKGIRLTDECERVIPSTIRVNNYRDACLIDYCNLNSTISYFIIQFVPESGKKYLLRMEWSRQKLLVTAVQVDSSFSNIGEAIGSCSSESVISDW